MDLAALPDRTAGEHTSGEPVRDYRDFGLPPEADDHTATNPPTTVSDLRDLAPDAFEVEGLDPDDDADITIEVRDSSSELDDTSWMAFPLEDDNA